MFYFNNFYISQNLLLLLYLILLLHLDLLLILLLFLHLLQDNMQQHPTGIHLIPRHLSQNQHREGWFLFWVCSKWSHSFFSFSRVFPVSLFPVPAESPAQRMLVPLRSTRGVSVKQIFCQISLLIYDGYLTVFCFLKKTPDKVLFTPKTNANL